MIEDAEYKEELRHYVAESEQVLRHLSGRRFLISGAAGLIGSYIADLLAVSKLEFGIDVKVIACDRDAQLMKQRFHMISSNVVECHVIDICSDELPHCEVDYIIHAASNTSPTDYAKKPIDTIWTNVYGTRRLCDFAVSKNVKRFLFCSSVEAYGRNNGDVEAFKEDYSGYVDCNTVRADYPTSKRCSEALLNAYGSEFPDFDFVIARIGRFYGPTVITGDAKAPSQFIRNAINGEDIVMKSDGSQLYSWGYVGDCATALLTLIAKGVRGEAYNVADPQSCRTLKDFATIAASAGGVSIRFVEQSAIEKAGYSKITKAVLDVSKLRALGWSPKIHLETGIPRTINYLKKEKL